MPRATPTNRAVPFLRERREPPQYLDHSVNLGSEVLVDELRVSREQECPRHLVSNRGSDQHRALCYGDRR